MSDPAARAFTERQRKRTGQRDELRDTHQRLQLGATLRGELHHLADDAARIAGYAEGNLPGLAERATVQLAGRRAYAARLYDTAQEPTRSESWTTRREPLVPSDQAVEAIDSPSHPAESRPQLRAA